MEKKVGFVLFENYHQRKNIGSSRIRGHWLLEKMPEAELFVQGKTYETIIFQKVYWKEMAKAFPGRKILDICDPDWLEGAEVVSFIELMDAVTVPTVKLKQALEKMTDKPIIVIPDRINFDTMIPPKKDHEGEAKSVVWFGYSHNIDVLDATVLKLKKLGLTLKVVSDGRYNTGECKVENVKWMPDTWQEEIQTADICLLPERVHGRALFKSQNKTEQAWALGLPVAKTPEDLERFMSGEERKKEVESRYAYVREYCDVARSVEEMRQVIQSIKK